MGYTKDKLVMFSPPESWDNGQTRYENFSKNRGLLTMQHAFKLFLKKFEKSVEKPTSRNERVFNLTQKR